MNKLRTISTAMIILGFILFVGGIVISMKELMEVGMGIGIAGIIGYAFVFLKGSTSIVEPKTDSE